MRATTIVFGLSLSSLAVLPPSPGQAAGKLYYGSRAGMQVTVVGVSGIGTRRALIRVKHLPEDAAAFCVDYENDKTPACVDRVLRDTHINDEVTGNCVTGTFMSLYGEKLRFVGENRHRSELGARYIIMRGREQLDGSSASGYGYDLEQFAALCPNRAEPEH